MKDWYGDSQLRAWSELNRGQWEENENSTADTSSGDDGNTSADDKDGE